MIFAWGILDGKIRVQPRIHNGGMKVAVVGG